MSETKFHDLHQFTTQLVATASEWAKNGDRDKARDIVRFIRNSQIVPILSAQSYQVGEPNWPLLRWKVDQLPDLDVTGLASCYDTARGIGIHGRAGADTLARKKGLHWVYALVAILVGIPLIVHFLPAILIRILHPGAATHLNAPPVVANSRQPAFSSSAPIQTPAFEKHEFPSHPFQDSRRPETLAVRPQGDFVGDTNIVFCTGYLIALGDVRCYFSDGSTAFSDAGEVDQVTPHFVTCWGRKFRVVLGHPLPLASQYQSQAFHQDYGQISEDPPVNQVDLLPTIHSQGGSPPPSLGGISQMNVSQSRTFQNASPSQQPGY